ncbi:hypothetical protein, partial [Escherichia coli]|uniref:hypothetical protein n=1 Tax=Escherichia coli TaxID=562 RepID=UPI00142D99A7
LLASSLEALRTPQRGIPRDAALAAFRRHLARAHAHVQDRFEAGTWTGLQSGRVLGRLTDGVIGGLHDYALGATQPDGGAEPMA